MPARNVEKYIRECIDSIINQSYEDWELIVVDDGSTDNTATIIKEFEKRESRIHLIEQSAIGIIPALRVAYASSRGKLITRMDADDIMANKKIENLSGLLFKHGPGHVATGLIEYFCATELGDGYKKYQTWLNNLTLTKTNYSEMYKECCIASPCWMLWREDFDACEAFNPNTYPEDYDLVFRFYRHGLKVISSDEILHLWRDHDSRSSRTLEQYKDNSFLEIKVRYFLQLDYDPGKELVLWGAGKKGKKVASLLALAASKHYNDDQELDKKESNFDFSWVCNNPKKIGQKVHQTLMQDSSIFDFSNTQVIITIANETEKQEALRQLDKTDNCSVFSFC